MAPNSLRRAIAIGSVLGAMVLVVLDASIANVALPTIATSLAVTPSMSVRIVTAYQMALVMSLLPCAALGESYGYRRVFALGVVLFTAASALCAAAPSLSWLVAARLLQGLGGAAVMSLGLAVLRLVVSNEQLGAAIGWNALTVALSTAAGPTIGAFILSGANWPWLFLVNIPVGVAVMSATRALPGVAGTSRAIDLISVAMNAGGFAALIVGAQLIPTAPVFAAALLVAALGTLAALIRREAPRQAPLIPLDLLRVSSFRVAVIASVCCFAGQTASLVALPFYLQHALGQSVFATGLYMTAWPLTVAVVAPMTGRLANRISTAWLCAAGGACLAAGLSAASIWPLDGNALPLVPLTMLCGVGFGLFNVANNRHMFLSAPRDRSGATGGIQGTARLLGQTAGAVIMALLLAWLSVDMAPRIGLAVGAVLTLTAGIISSFRLRTHFSMSRHPA